MTEFKPPRELIISGNLSENWRRFEQQFDIYMTASGLSEKSDEQQAMTLLHVAGPDALDIYNGFQWETEGDQKKLAKVKEQYQEYCNPKKNITYERHVFNTRYQREDENIDAYYTELRKLSKNTEFGTLTDSLIKDRIVCGIHSDSVRARLLRNKDLTLTIALETCRAAEQSVSQLKTLGAEAGAKQVHTVHRQSNASRGKPKQRYDVHRKVPEVRQQCKYCAGQHDRGKCPAFGKQCRRCGKMNHFGKACMTKKYSNAKQVNQFEYEDMPINEDEYDSTDLFIGTISTNFDRKESDWSVILPLNGVGTKMCIDTGAECNILSVRAFNAIGSALSPSSITITSFGGSKLKSTGRTTVNCKYKGIEHELNFEVINSNQVPNVIGLEGSEQLGLIKRVFTASTAGTDNSILSQYPDLFTGIGEIPGKCSIKLDPSVKPVIHPPRSVPVAIRDGVRKELERMCDINIIERVHEPTDWVNSMVTVVKPNKIRICIDPKDLNKAIKREHYPMNTIEDVATRLSGARYFTVLDASQGFYQIKLDDESSELTTFNTPFGRYKYLRMPMGIKSAPEIYQSAMMDMFENMDGVECVMDDILIWARTKEEHFERLIKVLDRAREKNLKLNRQKCKVCLPEVDYIGHVLSADGLKPSQAKISAITNMPKPEDKEAVLRLLGMITYVSKFIPNLSEIAAPLRELTMKETVWHWDKPQELSFQALKKVVTEAPVLQYCDAKEPVTLSVDASSKGLGACLLQLGRPVAYASKALTETEQRYAQMEKEMLAIVHGCTRFHKLIYGRTEIKVETDHKPLESIFMKPLFKAPMRLQKMMLRIQQYPLAVKYVSGKELYIADALSRAFVAETGKRLFDDELSVNMLSILSVSEEKGNKIKQATENDGVLDELKEVILSGWPAEKKMLPDALRPYWNERDELSVYDDIIYKGYCIVVPKTMRKEMLEKIHESHLGIEKCKRRARDLLYWPGMSSEIEDKITQCDICQEGRNKQQKQPLTPHEVPNLPWSKVGADLFRLDGNNYLILVDYYSGYFEIALLSDITTKGVIRHMKSNMARYGIVDELISDNGPQFASMEFKDFAKAYNFKHTTSSPLYPQANGLAEKSVQTAKRLLSKAKKSGTDPYLALLDYRNTPRDDTLGSPVQRLMGRRTKTTLPTATALLQPSTVKPDKVKQRLENLRQKNKSYYDKQAKPLSQLYHGDTIRMQTDRGWKPATIIDVCDQPQSYVVTTDTGTYRRNRRQLLQTKENLTITSPDDDANSEQTPTFVTATKQTTTEPTPAQPIPTPVQPRVPPIHPTVPPAQQPIVTSSGRVVRKPARYMN